MQISHSILFDLRLLHDYFTDGKGRNLEVVPAEDSIHFFKGAHVLWRSNGNAYTALIRQNGLHEPFINIVPGNSGPSQKLYRKFFGNVVYRFYLQARDPLFFNYTNTGNLSGQQVFYFSNLAANERNGTLYLTRPGNDHATGKEYLPGNLAAQPVTGNVFEAISKHTSANVSELSNPSLWAPKPAGHQYPSETDLIDHSPGNYLFALSAPATSADVSFFSFNYDDASPAYNVHAGTLDPQSFGDPRSEVKVDMTSLNPGKYRVQVNGESRMVYLDPSLSRGQVLGVIEIFNHLPGTNNYALLTDDEHIIGMSYTIRFPARSVLWKYIRKDSRAQAITDTGPTGYAFPLHADEFVSATPIPLSEAVLDTLELTFNTADFKLHPLPNPSAQRLGRFTQNGYDYLCSELFLNY